MKIKIIFENGHIDAECKKRPTCNILEEYDAQDTNTSESIENNEMRAKINLSYKAYWDNMHFVLNKKDYNTFMREKKYRINMDLIIDDISTERWTFKDLSIVSQKEIGEKIEIEVNFTEVNYINFLS